MNINDLNPNDYKVVSNAPTQQLNINDLNPNDYKVVNNGTDTNSNSSTNDSANTNTNIPDVGVGAYLNGGTNQPKADLSGVTDYSDANKPTVNPDGTISTISTGQPEDYQGAFNKDVTTPIKEGTEQVVAGARELTAGGAKVINDTLAHYDLPNEKATTDKAVKTLNSFIGNYNTKHPEQFMHPATYGELASYGAVPMGSGVMSATLTGGALTFLSSVGEDKSYSEATRDGIIGGLLTGGVTKALEFLPGSKANGIYRYMLDHYNIDAKVADSEFKQWRRVTGEADTTKNRIKALIDNLGTQGADIKSSMVNDPIAVKNLNKRIKDTKQNLIEASKSSFNVEDFAQDLKTNFKRVGQEYNDIKATISDKPTNSVFEPKLFDVVDDATTGDVAELKQLLGKDEVSVKDLLDSSPIVNSLKARAKGQSIHKWSVVKDQINSDLKDALSTKEYAMWKAANDNYAKMATVRVSKLGDEIQKAVSTTYKGSAKSTPEAVMRKLKTIGAGDDIFSNISDLVGQKHTAMLEKAIINRTLQGKNGNQAWETISKNLENKGFVTPEGQHLNSLVNDMKEVFKTDDSMRTLNVMHGRSGATIATTAEGKAAVVIIDKLSNMIRKHIPYSSVAKHLRVMDGLEDILREPTKVANFKNIIDNLNPHLKGIISNDYNDLLIKEEQKLIEHKPDSLSTGDVNLQPKYATQSGIIGDDASYVALHDAQTNLVRDTLGKGYSNDVINKVKSYINGRRFNTQLGRIKSEELQGNLDSVHKIIKSEVDKMVKRINIDHGVKLPKSEVEKIYKLKLKETK